MLQEIGITGVVNVLLSPPTPIPRMSAPDPNWPSNFKVFDQLRRLEHLAVVEVDFVQHWTSFYSSDMRNAWKRSFIEVFEDSPSRDRKLLRWRVIETRKGIIPERHELSESGEMEMFPGTPL